MRPCLLSFLIALLFSGPAFAADSGYKGGGIGEISNPAAVIDLNKKDSDISAEQKFQQRNDGGITPAIKAFGAKARKPLVRLRFTQKHAWFKAELRQAIREQEKQRAGVRYDVVSYTPSGKTRLQNERFSADASQRLNAVVSAMRELGVQPERITIRSEPSSAISSQEIAIFAN